MSEKNLDDAVDKLEAAVDPNSVISIGGYNFTPAKLMIAGTIVTSILGGLYGSFEIYKDYMDMKQKIQEYVTPDLSELYKKIEVLEASTDKTVEYTNEIKNDLKSDLRRLESVVENVERSTKTDQRLTDSAMREHQKLTDSAMKDTQRLTDTTVKEIRKYSDQTIREVNSELTKLQKETALELRTIRREVDEKIKKALDNPLANQ
jgi:galactokinase